MNAAVDMTSEADRLVARLGTENMLDYDPAEILPRQIAAVNERFQDRIGKIKLLQNRAETGGVQEVRSLHDIVPLLFAHTAYKSYPEGWLMEQKWDRLGRWLDTVSTYRVPKLDTSGAKGLDDWLGMLEERGHNVSCSSGTTGKCAMMNASAADLAFCGKASLEMLKAAGLKPGKDRRFIGPGQIASTPRNRATGRPTVEAFSSPEHPPFTPNTPPITIGRITDMVVLRKRMGEGTATPSEVAAYEAEVAAREQALESAIEQAADAMIAARHDKIHVTGMFASVYRVAERVRAKGYSGKDFNPENSTYQAGGLKRAQVPADYKEFIYETFNLHPQNIVRAYGMQENNTNALRCAAGRYHVAPWVMLLLLDEPGEALIAPPATGEAEGRAAFFDLSLDGRWGGVISGDKIKATWEPCACGARSPSVNEDIQRYADLASGDKITCAGTIDAYVRGVA
jgi:hypothetical protein